MFEYKIDILCIHKPILSQNKYKVNIEYVYKEVKNGC